MFLHAIIWKVEMRVNTDLYNNEGQANTVQRSMARGEQHFFIYVALGWVTLLMIIYKTFIIVFWKPFDTVRQCSQSQYLGLCLASLITILISGGSRIFSVNVTPFILINSADLILASWLMEYYCTIFPGNFQVRHAGFHRLCGWVICSPMKI